MSCSRSDRPIDQRTFEQRLTVSYSALPKDSENPNKNIIHNLCASAGSLLGYRYPGTYDGSGIVYGNASRLCDAILAFLYAVFSDVHGNQPYVAGRSVLHDVIVQLKSQLWRGHKGFCQVIPKVANGLQRYNAAVEASNEKVKEPIETVLNYVKPDGELRKGINDLQITETSTSAEDEQTVESAVSLVEGCKEVAKVFSKSLTAAKCAIDDLNPKLKRKLENARRSFFNHVDWLSRWSKKGEEKRLEQMVQKIKNRLKRLAKAVKDKIKREVHMLVQLLKKRVREIRMKLEGITASLGEYVKELGQWMGDAKEYIKDVKEYVDKIMKQLDGENRKKIDQAVAEIDSELGKKVAELNQWIEKADAAVKAAKEKADDVFKRLNKDDKDQKISQGVKKIDAARSKVESVSSELKTVHRDLETWKTAAQGVLRNSVQKASEVRDKLDPEKGKSTLGNEIDKIDTAKQGIVDANTQLGEKVKSLNKWIETAEDIRHKAEEKAKEAYDKLSVHDKLSENVQKIVDAKDRINEVNRNVTVHLESLNQWNQKAKKVLQGAIDNAQYVHDKLKDEVYKQIHTIEQNNKEVVEADKKLAGEISNLGKWKDAAGKVIDKAKAKCDEILKRVDKNHNGNEGGKKGPEIYVKANELQDHGKKLLKAATEAKQRVEQNVAKALEAVKAMDTDIKADLKVVKDKIKDGITQVIKDLKVDELGEKVKEDLKQLRGNIMKLETQVDNTNGNNLVSKALEELDKAKTATLDEIQQKIKDAASAMDAKFKSNVKDPLDKEAQNVYDNITELYGKMNPRGSASPDEKKTLEKIFDSIRKEVEKIKGDGGREEGIDGIVAHVRRLYNAFVQGNGKGVEVRIDGWLESILGINQNKDTAMQAVTSWITTHSGQGNADLVVSKELFKQKIKEALTAEIGAGQGMIRQEDVKDNIVQNLTKVKEACRAFVEALDKKLMKGQIDSVVDRIFDDTQRVLGGQKLSGENDNLKTAVRAALIALCSCVRQIAIEIEFLGISMFGEKIDAIKPTVDGLDKNLRAATNTGGAATGTAKAVDEAIKGVKDMVEKTITNQFESDVKKPVVDAIQGLDAAVKDYDTKAREQVKDAARGAITAAANVVSKSDAPNQMDLEHTMKNFHNSHKEITNNLEKDLREKVNTHIGKDVSTGGTTSLNAERVTLSDEFTNYTRHIDQHVNASNGPKGQLPQAIMEIRSEGLKELKNVVDDNTMNTESFTGPFGKISKGLDEIAGLITHSGFFGNHQKGGKRLLAELKDGLTKPVLGVFENGLDAITKVIDDLRKGTFDSNTKKIEGAIREIKVRVEALKKKLKSEDDKTGVIDQLTDLHSKGLASETWNGKSGSPVNGLKIIEDDLRKQNEELGKQTKEIGEAFDYTIKELKGMLGQVGLRLHNIIVPDDVVDNLRKLKLEIGRNKKVGLEHIYEFIKTLQEGNFTHKPEEIGKAKDEITEELKRLRGVLEGEKDTDVIKTLRDLQTNGLGSGDWKQDKNVKGHQAIETEVKKQQGILNQQPAQFDSGVKHITNALDELRTALKGGNGHPKDDVIDRLEGLVKNGLGDGRQNGTDGLGKIRNDLKEKNTKLSQASTKIDGAAKRVMDLTNTVLKNSKQALSSDVANDDILDSLKMLEEKIGLSGSTDASLQGIKSKIGELQSQALKDNSFNIAQAKNEIDAELRKLQSNLQDEVSSKLTDLVDNGFGGSEQWNGHNAKGFDNIKSNLQSQQSELSNQPKNIQTGVDEIINELQSLRTELQGTADDEPKNRGVVKNLDFMTEHIGGSENKGLKKMKSDIESLKSQVPLITKHLNSMSTEITNAAGQLGLNLNQLEDPHIDGKLKGIQSGLTNLRLTDLAAAIKMCDEFLIKADEIEQNTVQALWKHVDHEVDDAVNDLTKQARQHYVDSVKEALQLFAKKVNEDLEQLPGDINHDLTIGYKGFMKAVEGENSRNINKLKCMKSTDLRFLSAAFASFFGAINEYIRKETRRVHDEQNREKNPSLPPTDDPYAPKLNEVYKALTALLVYLRDNNGNTDKLTELVERLTKALGNLAPSDFKHPSTPLLDTVSRGLSKFAGEFSNTYISAYSGQRCREEHAHKYAKVLLSMIPMTYKALNTLMKKCAGDWKSLHICKFTADDRDNPLGNYLTKCGYRVSSSGSGQDGELNNMFTGGGIYELLTTPIPDMDIEMHLGAKPLENEINFVTIMSLLYNVLCHYFQVCHIYVPPKPRYPCTVRDMLSWLSGLQYTRVADKLPGHCKALLNRRCHDGDTPNKEDPIMAKCIGELPYTIARTCSNSTALLTAIQGNGQGFDLAAYPYSVDFSNNRAGLHYPADPAELLDMLRAIVCRLCRVLYFLYSQCCRSTARVKGWRECTYGRRVQSHHWQCQQIGTYSSTISTTTATITSSTTPNHGCPPTSPLQSFLSDSCHGLLPHTLTADNMVIECANCASNQPGQQCLSPLGFWDLGFAASIGGTGWDLAKRLGDMCRDADACLFVLCRTLHFLCPAAPSSLDDVFALYAQVLRQWYPHDRVEHRGGTYTDASDLISHLNTDGIDSLFPMWKELHGSYQNEKLTTAIASLAGHDHKSHDSLSTLFIDSTCKSPSGCAPYLQPLGLHANHTYPQKHAGLYITWIVHLAWQFWELLYQLLQALDNIDCTASGCATCPCQPGTHGGKDTCHCPSIVQCAGPLPTLYRYGFTYRNANLLVAANRTMRCGDLNTQLKEALHSDHFTELFRQIDQLIWHIRMSFLYFLIALWTITALYILHTFLYRIDILRIRSHILTTKASHLIAVKALLIPSRKMLSLYDANYFDDDPNELLNLKQ